MNKKYKNLLKNTGMLTLSSFSSKILTFFLVPLYTSALTTAEYGFYDIINTTTQIIYTITTVNIVSAVMRFLFDKNEEKKLIISIGVRYILASLLLVAILLLGNHCLNLNMEIDSYCLYIYLFYVSYTLDQFFIQVAKGLEKVKNMAIASLIGTIVTVVLNLVLLLFFKAGLKGFYIANIGGLLIPVLYYLATLKIWNLISLYGNKQLEKRMLAYSMPLIVSSLGWIINGSADKYVTTYFVGMNANGLLSVAYKIPSILGIIQTIFIQAWQISAVSEYGNDDTKDFYRKTFFMCSATVSIGSAILIMTSKLLAMFLYSKDFFEAWIYAPFLIFSSVMNIESGFLGPILSAEKNTKKMFWSALYGSVSNIILNIVLIQFIGVQGVTIATAISSLIIYFTRNRALGDMISGDKKYKKIVVAWIILIFECVITVYTDLSWINFVLLALLFIVFSNEMGIFWRRVVKHRHE